MKQPKPCGTWPSPLSVEKAAGLQRRLMQPRLYGGATYWLEGRPEEGGRVVLVRHVAGKRHDLTPQPFSVRTRAHEYGGGAYVPSERGLFFCNDSDQCIYLLEDGGMPRRLTAPAARRYADLLPDLGRGRLLCVCEDQAREPARDVLLAVSLADGTSTVLRGDAEFLGSPALSPDGSALAWLAWDGGMPWEGCELWLAEVGADGELHEARTIAGGTDESVFQPRWSPAGVLHFVSDRSGFWNLYRYAGGETRAICADAADYGFAQWVFGMSSYGFLSEREIAAVRVEAGRSSLVALDASGWRRTLAERYTHVEHLDAAEGRIALAGGAPDRVLEIAAGEAQDPEALSDAAFQWPADYLSRARTIRFATSGDEEAHAFYYPPQHPECMVPAGTAPPLILRCHGGPTSMNGEALDPRVQFWTSRGFAFVDLNYRGSTGYGRAYRTSLAGQWGLKDVEDCVRCLAHLAAAGLADAARAAVSGSSAGGFTALAAVAFHNAFRACAVQYGIAELQSAMTDTHRFEARYGDTLVGPWPEARELYRARSPLYAAADIRVPVIFFQGLKDAVVRPDQTARMLAALRARGVPAVCLTFPEEGHGFRRADTLRAVLAAELAFYGRVFGFAPADAVPSLDLSAAGVPA